MQLPFKIKDKMQMILFIGIQASGKTTLYNCVFAHHGLTHINLDILHSRSKEAIAIRTCLESRKSFVVDNTNPQRTDRQRYIPIAKSLGYEIIGIYFQSREEDCIKRNEQRANRVPRLAILCTGNKLQIPSYEEGFDQLYFARIIDNDSENEAYSFEITKF